MRAGIGGPGSGVSLRNVGSVCMLASTQVGRCICGGIGPCPPGIGLGEDEASRTGASLDEAGACCCAGAYSPALLSLASNAANRSASSGGSGTDGSLSHRELSSRHSALVRVRAWLLGLALGLATLELLLSARKRTALEPALTQERANSQNATAQTALIKMRMYSSMEAPWHPQCWRFRQHHTDTAPVAQASCL